MISRRDLLLLTGLAGVAAALTPMASALLSPQTKPRAQAVRSINVVNFIRAVEPRGPMDLFLPVQKQMEISLKNNLPTTWLLQYDALVSGPFVDYLKTHMAKDHEVGIWFEMNEMHCKAAGVKWRGRPGYEWDHYPSVAFTIGYTAEERIKLADTFMATFKQVWGKYPKSVASWNLDTITMAHLADHYGVDAFAVCRDQIATDGFTIWGAPIAGYYPSKTNCWSPALDRKNQINAPVFRMLGQDPVYYYQGSFPMPGGQRGSGPDTMEPVWSAGRSPEFVKNFLQMISDTPTLAFAYAQLGQENSFGWPEMERAYPLQMKALADLRATRKVHVETMGDSGRRFKKAFKTTPPQAQIMLEDPFGNVDHTQRSVWYQSRFYRADLHFVDDLPYLRDLTLYSDQNPQPFLHEPTKANDVEQRMPAILDGFHWSPTPGSPTPGAGGFFLLNGQRLRLTGKPKVQEVGARLLVELPVTGGRTLSLDFEERKLTIRLTPQAPLVLSFEWDPSRSSLVEVGSQRVRYRWQGFDYSVTINDKAESTTKGWSATGKESVISLALAQGG